MVLPFLLLILYSYNIIILAVIIMANINWRIAVSVTSSSNSQPIAGTYSQTGSGESIINQNFPSNTNSVNTNTSAVSINFNAPGNATGDLQAIILLSNQNVTIYTNNANANAAQDTLHLVGGIPLEWDNSLIYNCPFNGSVNGMYITCNTATLLQGKVLTY